MVATLALKEAIGVRIMNAELGLLDATKATDLFMDAAVVLAGVAMDRVTRESRHVACAKKRESCRSPPASTSMTASQAFATPARGQGSWTGGVHASVEAARRGRSTHWERGYTTSSACRQGP